MSVFNVPENVVSPDYDIIRVKANAGATINILLYLREIPKLDNMHWDGMNDDELEEVLSPVLKFLGEEDGYRGVHKVIKGAFPDVRDHAKKDLKFLDHFINNLEEKILKL